MQHTLQNLQVIAENQLDSGGLGAHVVGRWARGAGGWVAGHSVRILSEFGRMKILTTNEDAMEDRRGGQMGLWLGFVRHRVEAGGYPGLQECDGLQFAVQTCDLSRVAV